MAGKFRLRSKLIGSCGFSNPSGDTLGCLVAPHAAHLESLSLARSYDRSCSPCCCSRREVKASMVKVVPTEGSPINQHGDDRDRKEEDVTSSDNNPNSKEKVEHVLVHPLPNDDDADIARTEAHPVNHATDDTRVGKEDQSLGSYPSDHDGVQTSTGTETDDAPGHRFKASEEGSEVQQEPLTQEASGRNRAAEHPSQVPRSTLDMKKHSGMTTFSLMRQGSDSSLRQTTTPNGKKEQEEHVEETGLPIDQIEEGDDTDDQLESAGATFARRGTHRFVRQDTGVGLGDGVLNRGSKKKRPFRVPQTMFMGHPLGSPAAEFLERQQHRLAEVKSRREVVAGRVGLVTEHNPSTTVSGLPNIDEVFPDKKDARDNAHGDWCV